MGHPVVCPILYDDGSSFVCWFYDNVAIGLESMDGGAFCLSDVFPTLAPPHHIFPKTSCRIERIMAIRRLFQHPMLKLMVFPPAECAIRSRSVSRTILSLNCR
eukprot:g27139.t1